MYAYVLSEKYASLRRLFQMFKNLMGERGQVRTFIMDKLAAQIRAVNVVFGCDINLCYFHIREAVRRHVSDIHGLNCFADQIIEISGYIPSAGYA